MADDPSKTTQAQKEQEERDRQMRQSWQNSSFLTSFGGGSGDFMGMLAKLMQTLLGGLGGLLGNFGRSMSTEFGNFRDGVSGRGDTPLAPRGSKPSLGIGNTVGTSIRSGWEGVLDVIGKHESGGDYNRVYGPGVKRINLTDMTIDAVQAWQKQYVRSGSPSSAVGKYQILGKTLAGLEKQMGLTGKEKFDEAMQDRMAMQLLENRGISKLAAGKMTTGQIVNEISKEWAAIENTSGKGSYDGDGLNKAARGSGRQLAHALQAAVNADDLSRSSAARKIDPVTTAKTPSASAEMAKVASAPGDPIADRKIIQANNGAPVFVGNYGAGSQGQKVLADITPDKRPAPGPAAPKA